MKIYDITGMEIHTFFNNEFKTADYYTVEFNATKFASGVYFYRIQTDKFTQVKRMILLK